MSEAHPFLLPHDPNSLIAEGGRWLYQFQVPGGPLVRFRHVTPDDAEAIAAAVRTASPETLLHRFFTPIRSVSPLRLRELLTIDRPASLCLVGEIEAEHESRIICGARFVRSTAAESTAEFALTIHDDYQQRGLGTFLMHRLAEQAMSVGVETLEGYLLYSNVGMRRLVTRVAANPHWFYEEDVVRVTLSAESLMTSGHVPVEPR